MSCGDVEACAFFKETSPGVYRVSLRSKCDVNVARIAERFGGGGHRNAAGCTFQGTWDEAEREVVRLLVEAVENRGNGGGGAVEQRVNNGGGGGAPGEQQPEILPPPQRTKAQPRPPPRVPPVPASPPRVLTLRAQNPQTQPPRTEAGP